MAHILLVDDDADLRDIIALTLASAGHSVTEAKDGGEAIQLFRRKPVDLIVTDLIMPGQEGIETIVTFVKEHPEVPIIAMSGGVDHSPLYLGLAAKLGAQRTLAKPFRPAELLQAIEDVLKEARNID